MALYFPALNSNLILTQLPYSSSLNFQTIAADMETGMRWTFSRRGNVGLTGYSGNPLGKFNINFSAISDAEVAVLQAFMQTTFGRYLPFRLLDPGGNLLQWSENFAVSYWDKSSGISVVGPTTDPHGGVLATRLSASYSDSSIKAVVGPSDGGVQGFVFTASAWLRTEGSPQTVQFGFISSGGVLHQGAVEVNGTWQRRSFSVVWGDQSPFRIALGGGGSWSTPTTLDVYGMMVSPMKGEGSYVGTYGGFYGYHQNCRFNVDSFVRQVDGPGRNSVTLPCVEFNV